MKLLAFELGLVDLEAIFLALRIDELNQYFSKLWIKVLESTRQMVVGHPSVTKVSISIRLLAGRIRSLGFPDILAQPITLDHLVDELGLNRASVLACEYFFGYLCLNHINPTFL